jgi:hypothetical protein
MRFAITVVRCWTALYTWRLPADLRAARRAEIESDLWELAHDREQRATALQILLRCALGVADDVGWRVEHLADHAAPGRMWVAIATTMAVVVLAGLWIANAMQPLSLPTPPERPIATISGMWPPPAPTITSRNRSTRSG